MPITNVTRSIDLNNNQWYLPHPAGRGIDNGYYLIYSASSATNLITSGVGLVKGYKWGTALSASRTDGFHPLVGTIQIVSESLSGSSNWVKYHGSNIIHIGRGTNDITGVNEDDALFFAHLGQYGSTTQTDDAFFYWDRLYLGTGSSTWTYYQYHAHNPTSYPPFDNGRLAMAAKDRHGPAGIEEYGHMINVNVKSGGTNYLSVLARVHTPSVGGAHNSHNDLELPSTSNKNYMMGGIVNGASDRFHCFYLTANGTQWDVFSRTFNYVNQVFNAEVSHGTYDLADPLLARTPGSSSLYPFRASTGIKDGAQIYIPVIYNSGSSGRFDLKVWNFTSAANLAQNPTVTTIYTGSIVRPDCHLAIANNTIYAAVTDANAGGVDLFKLSGSNWVNEGQIVANSASVYLRVHGLDFNASEFKFYTMISGQQVGSGTYSGSGVYSFSPDIPFTGYKHLDYITGSNSFIIRNALTNGYVQYDSTTGALKRSAAQEPQGIDATMPVLQYDDNSPQFTDRRQIILSGNENFSQCIELKDGRLMCVGTKADVDPDFDISYTNGIIGIFSPGDTSPPELYEITGRFDDFITGITQATGSGLVNIVGFTKDELVPKSQLFVHGIGRGLIKSMTSTEKLEYVDLTVNASTGDQFVVGNHIESSSIIVAKYTKDFDLDWQRDVSGGSLADTAYGIARDSSGNIYVAGKTNNSGSGNDDALLMKLDSTGSILWTRMYGTSTNQYASSVATITKSGTQYVLLPIVSGSTTTFTIIDTNGSIQQQVAYPTLVTNRVRRHETTTNDGRFTFAGEITSSVTTASFGVGTILESPLINWMGTHQSGSANTEAFDMRNTGTGSLFEYMVAGTEGTNGFVMKFLSSSAGLTRSWVTTTSGSYWKALANTPSSVTSASRNTFVVGAASGSGDSNQSGNKAIVAGFDHTGSMWFINALGHTGNESFNAVERDYIGFNYIGAGKSTSHTNGQRGLTFRFSRNGFGTGNHHLQDVTGMAMWYASASLLVASSGLGTFTTPTVPVSSSGGLLTSSSLTFTSITSSYENEVYEGSNVFDGFFGVINLNDLQEYKNSGSYVEGALNPINSLVTWTQIGVAGDGEADDGNIFAYDVIELTSGSNAGRLVITAQTSGDVVANNKGASGVYDYMVAFYDPSNPLSDTGFLITQVGTTFDEEIYASSELSDGRVAFVGRTVGDLGGPTVGGYDIFLGIIDARNISTTTVGGATRFTTDYYVTGSGLADRGVNIHDVHTIIPNTLAIVYETSGDVSGQTNLGAEDIGVILFNYSTDTWGTVYQVGTTQNDTLDTIGKPSTFLADGRIAIVGSTTGVFADDGNAFGASDVFLGILDLNTGTWKKYQIGTGAADFGNSVRPGAGNKLIIAGSTAATFTSPNDGITVNFNAARGIKGRLTE
jgi:hypothetical protein